MVVDTRKCIGCNACTIACRAENPTGPGAAFRKVVERELPIGPRPFAVHKPMNCLQCDDPPCARAVPAGMITKRPDGIVAFDERLRGPYATAAAQACPWDQIVVDNGRTYTQNSRAPQRYENRSFVEQGRVVSRKPGASTLVDSARKCNFCSHLLDAGVLPACVSTCIGGAMYFIEVSARDAQQLGLRDGDKARIVSVSNPDGAWDLGHGNFKHLVGTVKVTSRIRLGVISFALGYGHWAYGSSSQVIDGAAIPGDPTRATGIHANSAMMVDSHTRSPLSDVVGGSAVFYDSKVFLVKV